MPTDFEKYREGIVDGPPLKLYDFLGQDLSDGEPRDNKLVDVIIEAFEAEGYEAQKYQHPYFPVDIYCRRNGKDWVCIEAKDSNCSFAVMQNGPSSGVFFPENKVRHLVTAIDAGFDHSLFAYRIEGDIYYFTYKEITKLWVEEKHPLPNDEDKVRKEGCMSIPIHIVRSGSYTGIPKALKKKRT